MRNPLYIFSVAIIIFTTTIVSAQEFPPDSADIFIAEVNVIDIDVREPYDPNIETTRPYIDDTTRTVQVYDETSDMWQGLSFPDEIPDDVIPFISYWYDDIYYIQSHAGAWGINTEALTFEPIELVCNQVPDQQGKGRWVITIDRTTDTESLCLTEVDGIFIDLPNEYYFLRDTELPITPDEEWILLFGSQSDERGMVTAYPAYSYNTANNELLYIGTIEREGLADNRPYPSKWLNETHTLLTHGESPESIADVHYAIDIAQPDSIEFIYRGWNPEFNETYQRFEYMTTDAFVGFKTGSFRPEHLPCELIVYDERGIFQHEIGYDCLGRRYTSAGDKFYTVIVEGNPATNSSLIQLDIVTGEIQEILSGSIEGVISVSSDNRYLLVAKGNGDIRRVDFYQIPQNDVRSDSLFAPVGNVNIAVYDMQTNSFVYEFEWGNSWGDIHVNDCGDGCSVFTLEKEINYQTDPPTTQITNLLIKLSGDVQMLSESVFTLSPDGTKAIVERDNTIGVLSIADNSFYPLYPVTIEPYNISSGWQDTNTISTRISLDSTDTRPFQAATFLVQLPE